VERIRNDVHAGVQDLGRRVCTADKLGQAQQWTNRVDGIQPLTGSALSEAHGNPLADVVHAQRLGQVIDRARLHGLYGRFDGAIAGHHDDVRAGVHAPHLGQQTVPSHARHAPVGQNEIAGRHAKQLQADEPVGGFEYRVALVPQRLGEYLPNGIIIVYDQDSTHGACSFLVRRRRRSAAGPRASQRMAQHKGEGRPSRAPPPHRAVRSHSQGRQLAWHANPSPAGRGR